MKKRQIDANCYNRAKNDLKRLRSKRQNKNKKKKKKDQKFQSRETRLEANTKLQFTCALLLLLLLLLFFFFFNTLTLNSEEHLFAATTTHCKCTNNWPCKISNYNSQIPNCIFIYIYLIFVCYVFLYLLFNKEIKNL